MKYQIEKKQRNRAYLLIQSIKRNIALKIHQDDEKS